MLTTTFLGSQRGPVKTPNRAKQSYRSPPWHGIYSFSVINRSRSWEWTLVFWVRMDIWALPIGHASPLVWYLSWYLQLSTRFVCFMVDRFGHFQGPSFYIMSSIVTVRKLVAKLERPNVDENNQDTTCTSRATTSLWKQTGIIWCFLYSEESLHDAQPFLLCGIPNTWFSALASLFNSLLEYLNPLSLTGA